jgi:hypothetical protein
MCKNRHTILVITAIVVVIWFSAGRCEFKVGPIFTNEVRLSDAGVSYDFYGDTTIVLKCDLYIPVGGPSRESLYEHLEPTKYIIEYDLASDQTNWFIDFPLSSGVNYTNSPDKERVFYCTSRRGYHDCYLEDFSDNRKVMISTPDSLRIRDYIWNPKQDCILISGYYINHDGLTDQSGSKIILSGWGPVYYIYYPETDEWRLIYSGSESYHKMDSPDAIWHQDGNQVFFSYIDDEFEYECLIRYDMRSGEVDTLYNGGPRDQHMLNGFLAHNDGIPFQKWHYDQGKDYYTQLCFLLLNPETMEFKEIWNSEDKTRKGKILFATLSPDYEFVAYYTSKEFVIEKISNNENRFLFDYPTTLGSFRRHADFTDDSRGICFSISHEPKDDNSRLDFGILKFGYGEIIEK